MINYGFTKELDIPYEAVTEQVREALIILIEKARPFDHSETGQDLAKPALQHISS